MVWHAGLYQKIKVVVDGNGKSLQEQSLYMKINTGQKTQLVSFDQFNYTVAVYVKMDGSVFEEKSSFKILGLNLIGAVTSSPLLKLAPRELEPWFVLWSFFLLRLLCIYLYKSTIWPSTEYCCHILARATMWYLGDYTVGSSLAAFFEHLTHRQIVASCRYYFGRFLS